MAISEVFFIGSTYTPAEKVISVIRKTLDGVINDKETDIYVYENRDYRNPVGVDDILWYFDSNKNLDTGNKKYKFVIVNMGYHHYNSERNISMYFHDYNESSLDCGGDSDIGHFGSFVYYSDNLVLDGEMLYTGKFTGPATTLVKATDTIYILYVLYDLFYSPSLTSCSIKTFEDSLEFFAVNENNSKIFDKKYRDIAIESNKEKTKPNYNFNSVYSVAQKIAPSAADKEQIKNEMLSKVDIKCFIGVINASIARISGKNYLNSSMAMKWLEEWADKKWPLYLLFGRNLFVKQRKEIKMDEVMLKQSINSVYFDYPQYAITLNKFSMEEWENNVVLNARNEVLKYFPAKPGTKLTRYCSHLFKNPELDVALSKIIQNKNIDGYVYLSIDPNDFLTSSITKHGWRSCHNCVDGGRASGPLSYLFDNCTIVAYLTNDAIYRYNYGEKTFDWNSKYWRQLVTIGIEDNTMIFQREYPQNYVNGELTTEVRNMMESVVSKFTGSDNMWVWKNNGARKDSVYTNAINHLHYDDIPARNTKLVKHIALKGKSPKTIIIGSQPICPICRKNRITDTRLMTCNTCHNKKFVENKD